MIQQKITIPNATSKEIYDLLLDAKCHSELIGDKAYISDEEGAEFSTFGEYATGKNLRLQKDKVIEQTWRASDWPEGHFSKIRFELADSNDGAVITFTQKDLPDGTQEEFESGWDDFYWQPLMEYFDS